MKMAFIRALAFTFLFVSSFSFSYSQTSKSGLKFVDNGNYNKALDAFSEDISGSDYVPLAQFGMGKLFSTIGFSEYNLDTAYHYTVLSEKSYRKMDRKIKDRLRKKFNTSIIKKQKKAIAKAAFNAAEEENTLEAWDHFLAFYKKPGYKYEKSATVALNEKAFNHAEQQDTWQAYNELIDKYGKYMIKRSPGLYKRAETQLLNKYIEAFSWNSFDDFKEKFPRNFYVKNDIKGELDSIASLDKISELNLFITKYDHTVFAQRAKDSIAVKLPQIGSYEECKIFLENERYHPASNLIWKRLYAKYKNGRPNLDDLNFFENTYPEFPFKDQLKQDRDKLIQLRYNSVMLFGTPEAHKRFIDQFPDYEKVDSVWINYYDQYKADYPGLDYLERFESLNPDFPYPDQLAADKKSMVDQMADNTLTSNDLMLFKTFVNKYPDHSETPKILKKYYQLYKKNTISWQALEQFKKDNPDFPDKAMIDKDIAYFRKNEEKLAFQALANTDDESDYFNYLKKFPASTNSQSVQNTLSNKLLESGNQKDIEKFIQRFPKDKNKSKLLRKIYKTIAKEGSKEELMIFNDENPGIISPKELENDLKNVKIKDYELGLYSPAKHTLFQTYIKQNAPDDKAYRALKKMLSPALNEENYELAAKIMSDFQNHFKNENEKYNKLLFILTSQGYFPKSKPISSNVNTPDTWEYAPIISADGNTLLICSNKMRSAVQNENIHVSKRSGENWLKPIPIRELSTYKNEAPEALSADGNSMVLFVEGKLCISEKQADGWSTPAPLSNAVNKDFWQADARITADGKALLFASGSSVWADDIDIYVSVKDEDGNWTKAHSLGNVINTNKADRAPYLHPDLKTLYFCSKGHVGLGKYDVFVSKRLDDGWTNWSEPVNLGIGLNSAKNEWEFKVTTDGSMAYFSKEKKDGDVDIFIADLPEAYQPEKVSTISGSLKGIDGEPISAEILWEDLETGEIVQITRSDPTTGDFFATLPEKGKFGYSVQHPGFFPLSGNIDISEEVKNIELEEEMILATIDEMKATGMVLNLNNLFFETAKYDIKPTSYPELNRLVEWMNKYNLVIEILGHTDNVGEDHANQSLSENRAGAVKDYLIARGCKPEAITAIGFGEQQPVASNDNAKGRAKNRRVEIRIKK